MILTPERTDGGHFYGNAVYPGFASCLTTACIAQVNLAK